MVLICCVRRNIGIETNTAYFFRRCTNIRPSLVLTLLKAADRRLLKLHENNKFLGSCTHTLKRLHVGGSHQRAVKRSSGVPDSYNQLDGET